MRMEWLEGEESYGLTLLLLEDIYRQPLKLGDSHFTGLLVADDFSSTTYHQNSYFRKRETWPKFSLKLFAFIESIFLTCQIKAKA